MDYHLDNKVRLSTDSKHSKLYSWSLQEFDHDGKQIGRDQVPWFWSLYFEAVDLKNHFALEIKENLSDENGEGAIGPTDVREIITASLRPQSSDGSACSYSMFGTQRNLDRFDLTIYKLAEGKTEKSMTWGSVSYTSELDFQDVTQQDQIGFELQLSPDHFNKILNLITLSSANQLVVRLSKVHGFYSEWSPSIRTHQIKILANRDDQGIEIPQHCQVDPPVLGYVGEFYISLGQNQKLDSILSLDDEVEDEVEDQDSHKLEEDETKDVGTNENVLSLLQNLEKRVFILSIPLWIIAAILAFRLLS